MNESQLWQLRAGIITESEYQTKIQEALPGTAPVATNTVIPADVKNLAKAQSTATSVQSRAKLINTPAEFAGAFENWFKTLGLEPGKATKGNLRTQVDKVLTNLGYK